MPVPSNKSWMLFEFKTFNNQMPTCEEFKKTFAFGAGDVDESYDFMPMRKTNTFIARVTQEASERVAASGHSDFVGMFVDTPVAPTVSKPPRFGF